MLTVARCTRAAVWTRVMGLPAVSEVEDQLWKALHTLPSPRELLPNLVAIVDGTLLIRGMECCLMHSLAYSQVTGLGRKTFAVRARLEIQGTNTVVHGGGGVGYAEVPHNNAAQSIFSVPDRQILSAGRLKVHIAVENMVGQIEVGCKDWQAAVSRLAPLSDVMLVADSARVVVEVHG